MTETSDSMDNDSMEKAPFDKNLAAAYLFLTIAVLNWAVNTVLARGLIHTVNPMTLSFFRWLTAWLVILPFGLKRVWKERQVIRSHFRQILVLSILSVTCYNTIIYLGARYTTATNMSFVIATTPATTFIISWLILREKASGLTISGMLVSLFGMTVIIFKGRLENFLALSVDLGDLIVYGSVLCWAVYSVLLRHFKLAMDRVAFLTLIISLGLIFIIPLYVWETIEAGAVEFTPKTLGTFVFLGIFPSIVSYLCWNEGVKRAGPNTASIFMNLIPVIASLIAFTFLGEGFYLYHAVGGAIILSGLLIAVFFRGHPN